MDEYQQLFDLLDSPDESNQVLAFSIMLGYKKQQLVNALRYICGKFEEEYHNNTKLYQYGSMCNIYSRLGYYSYREHNVFYVYNDSYSHFPRLGIYKKHYLIRYLKDGILQYFYINKHSFRMTLAEARTHIQGIIETIQSK